MSMSSEGDQDTVQPAVPAPISADSFAGVRDLISLVVSERACNARLRQLKQAQAMPRGRWPSLSASAPSMLRLSRRSVPKSRPRALPSRSGS